MTPSPTPNGTEKKLAFGAYPEVSLKAARDLRDDARKLLAAGIDPAEKKKQDRHAAKVSAANSFLVVAQSYIAKCKREGHAEATTTKQEWLLKLLDRAIGQRPIAEIQPFEMLEAVRKHETTGRTEAAHRALQFASQVFRFAIANQLAASDPTRDLRGALTSHKSKHHAAILEPKKAGELLRAIDGYDGHPGTTSENETLNRIDCLSRLKARASVAAQRMISPVRRKSRRHAVHRAAGRSCRAAEARSIDERRGADVSAAGRPARRAGAALRSRGRRAA
ncbi:integrase arm-type DNA-binding domain-containing protein [Novosphingobium sp. AAP93]|uniref:tyrosine-type recombinase/integrase n=1 Tax=Novosphingobium sp. AAP93 TaxID=1523427 RepID=UPI0006B9B9C1|nr:integrase arm-type DNA-binding domain-containing protein [Novosphingobium sp. AAP93]